MKLTVLFIILFAPVYLLAQDINISGTITDANTKEPVSGASITVKDKLTGTTTDAKGNFQLIASRLKLPVTLIISSVNYEAKEIAVTNAGEKLSIEITRE